MVSLPETVAVAADVLNGTGRDIHGHRAQVHGVEAESAAGLRRDGRSASTQTTVGNGQEPAIDGDSSGEGRLVVGRDHGRVAAVLDNRRCSVSPVILPVKVKVPLGPSRIRLLPDKAIAWPIVKLPPLVPMVSSEPLATLMTQLTSSVLQPSSRGNGPHRTGARVGTGTGNGDGLRFGVIDAVAEGQGAAVVDRDGVVAGAQRVERPSARRPALTVMVTLPAVPSPRLGLLAMIEAR